MIANDPLLGVGFDAFGVGFTQFDTRNGIFRVEQAHNDYLQMLTDGGIFAFLLVGLFIFLLFQKSLSVVGGSSDKLRRSLAIGALAGCLGIMIHSFFDFPLRTHSNTYFFLMLAVIATADVAPEHHRRRKGRRISS
jgi:O-antigen ligase